MSNSSYLILLSSPTLWWEYSRVASATYLGTSSDFEIEFPEETDIYFRSISEKMAKIAEEEGTKIGQKKYKDFKINKTRLTTEDVDELWQPLRFEMQNMLNDEYKNNQKDQLVPGIEKITSNSLIPTSKQSYEILNNNKNELDNKLQQMTSEFTIDRFLINLRNVAWSHWQREFDLYKNDVKENTLKIQ